MPKWVCSTRRLRYIFLNTSSNSYDQIGHMWTHDPEESIPTVNLRPLDPHLYINDKRKTVKHWCGVTGRATDVGSGDVGLNPSVVLFFSGLRVRVRTLG